LHDRLAVHLSVKTPAAARTVNMSITTACACSRRKGYATSYLHYT
jgi:hypothetical protein